MKEKITITKEQMIGELELKLSEWVHDTFKDDYVDTSREIWARELRDMVREKMLKWKR